MAPPLFTECPHWAIPSQTVTCVCVGFAVPRSQNLVTWQRSTLKQMTVSLQPAKPLPSWYWKGAVHLIACVAWHGLIAMMKLHLMLCTATQGPASPTHHKSYICTPSQHDSLESPVYRKYIPASVIHNMKQSVWYHIKPKRCYWRAALADWEIRVPFKVTIIIVTSIVRFKAKFTITGMPCVQFAYHVVNHERNTSPAMWC